MPGVNGPNAAGAPSIRESVGGTVPPTVAPGPDTDEIGASNACTSSCGVWKATSADPPLAIFRAPASLTGSEMTWWPAVTACLTSATTRPLMSGDHGGIEPSVSAHADRPSSAVPLGAQLELNTGM